MKTKFCLLFSVISMSMFIGLMQTKAQIAKQPDGVSWEIFNNKTTYDLNLLRTTDSIPDQIIHLDSLYTTNNSTLMDFFTSRIRGYLIPPVSGEFTFYFACDNTGQFWLSPDTAIANAQLKNEIFSLQNDWSQNTSSQEMLAGQKYYFEVVHYDTANIDMVKLGWKIPGDTIPIVIKTPYITSCGENVLVKDFNIPENEIFAYPGYTTSTGFILSPWNSTDKSILWHSSNETIASVNEEGIITTISPGSCLIIGAVAENSALSDTIHVTVIDYYGPFFVKQNAIGTGHSWDDAIDLPLLTQRLQQGHRESIADIYISEGVYKPTNTIDRNKTFLLNNIRLVGGFSATSSGTDTTTRNIEVHETILSGEIGVPDETIDNSYHVVVNKGPSIIDGISIRDGRASCSTYSFIPGFYTYKRDDNGGGILVESANTELINCKITNNSAWNAGAGINCRGGNLSIYFSQIKDNQIQQIIYYNGGWFQIIANGYGGGICVEMGSCNLDKCVVSGNSAMGHGKAMAIRLGLVNIENCSFFSNSGSTLHDMWLDNSTVNMNNSTIIGSINPWSSTFNLKNSSIIGGGYVAFDGNHLLFDNSIWTEPNLIFYEGTTSNTWQAKYSILGDSLFGADKSIVISGSIPDHTTWLDSLAYNGGSTPTMKLKNIPGNYALNYGNPLYLDSTDQRGAIRTNFVSIGAYQWVDATEIVISPHQLTITQGDSIDFDVYFLPAFVSDGFYSLSCSDNSIARVDSLKIYALTPGFVNIIAQSSDGMLRDTLLCQVVANAGIEEVNQNTQFKVYPNPVEHDLTIESKGNTGKVNYEVVSAFGQMVTKGSFIGQTTVITSNLKSGLYVIKCTVDGTTQLIKIIKE